MKKIYFRKILPYDPTFGGKYSRYEGYSTITRQEDCPGIIPGSKFNLEAEVEFIGPVFCSDIKRGVQSAEEYSKVSSLGGIKKTKLLREIKFDLTKLVTKEEFEKYGSNIIRKRFIDSFIADSLTEKIAGVKKRVYMLKKLIKNLPHSDYLFVSHSFFMKIFEVYWHNKNLFKNPSILKKFFNYQKKTFNNASGFQIEIENNL